MVISKRSRTAALIFAVTLPVAMGWGGVYVKAQGADNGRAAPTGRLQVAQAAATTSSQPAPTLAHGAMVKFVFKKEPEALPEIGFVDAKGQARKLSDFKGRTVLLNLWATWCAPCRKEMPALDRLQAAMGSDKFEVVALSVDRAGIEASRKFLDGIKVTHLQLYVDQTAKANGPLKVFGMPTTILVDAEGREVGRLLGEAEWDSDEAKKLIQSIMR